MQLARDYGVSPCTISAIVLGRLWPNAGGPVRVPPSREPSDRFWSKVAWSEDVDACWLWQAAPREKKKPYGAFWLHGRNVPAHQFSWEWAHDKKVPPGKILMHKCDTHACVNYHHLVVGTHQDNMSDKVAKGRQTRGDDHHLRKYPERIRRGSQVYNAKTNDKQVSRMRKLHALGVSTVKLAELFGLGRSNVKRIVNRSAWKHVP